MPRAILYAGIVLAVGCASRPDFSTVATNSVSMRPAVVSGDVVEDDEEISPGGQVSLVSQSVESDPDVRTTRRSSGVDDEPEVKPQVACLLPTWSVDDAAVATSDQVAVPVHPNSVLLPHYIVEKEAPAGDKDSKTSNDLSAPPRKSPFMLLRLTEKKGPPIRQ